MKDSRLQYIVGALLLLFALYQTYLAEWWECALYASAGAGFITLALISDKVFPKYNKALGIVAWVLIFMAGFLLYFLLRTDS